MERLLIDPNNCLPVRRGPLQEFKILLLLDAFTNGRQDSLHPVKLAACSEGWLTRDGNHRLTLGSYFETGRISAELYKPTDFYVMPSGLTVPVQDLISSLEECRRLAISRGYRFYADLCQ